ncbi:unnamed protein product, partial [Larinioides sclopetarius]
QVLSSYYSVIRYFGKELLVFVLRIFCTLTSHIPMFALILITLFRALTLTEGGGG